MMATMGAAYMTITSPVDDRLLGAAVDPSVADHAEVHEVVMVESTDTTMAMGMGSDTTMAMGGEMTMREVDHIDLMAGEPLELAPGGYHIMIIDLVAPLEVGNSVSITLSFETAGDIVVDVPVLDEAP
jgi:copper(I)-binding protein